MKRRLSVALLLLFSTACAGVSKDCSQALASNLGANWIVVQYAMDGRPFNCWKLRGASLDSSEGGSINWKDPSNGHLVHLTGWENRVQVVSDDYTTAGRLLGIDSDLCVNGIYPAVSRGK